MSDLKDFAEQLVNLNVKEVNELADILKEEYGINLLQPLLLLGPALGGGGDAAEEKTEFDVILKSNCL